MARTTKTFEGGGFRLGQKVRVTPTLFDGKTLSRARVGDDVGIIKAFRGMRTGPFLRGEPTCALVKFDASGKSIVYCLSNLESAEASR